MLQQGCKFRSVLNRSCQHQSELVSQASLPVRLLPILPPFEELDLQGCLWSGKFKVREKSGNFEKSQGNLEFSKKSGKFSIGQGNFDATDEYFTYVNGAKPVDDHRI